MTGDLRELAKMNRAVRRRMGCAFLIGVSVLSFCISLYLVLQLQPVQKGYIFPFPHRELIEEYATRYNVDKYLVAAVIKCESSFELKARSHRGAVGLMQLMPDTALWIAGQLEDDDFTLERLDDPGVNIPYGIWYLSELGKEFDGNKVLTLAAYNAGRGNVREWMLEYGWERDFDDIKAIPFDETRNYVAKVLKYWKKYRSLYRTDTPDKRSGEDVVGEEGSD